MKKETTENTDLIAPLDGAVGFHFVETPFGRVLVRPGYAAGVVIEAASRLRKERDGRARRVAALQRGQTQAVRLDDGVIRKKIEASGATSIKEAIFNLRGTASRDVVRRVCDKFDLFPERKTRGVNAHRTKG